MPAAGTNVRRYPRRIPHVKTHPGARRAGRGAIAGLLAGAVAVGAGQLVAGITGAGGSPVVAVGQLQIDFTPPWLKNFAISEFGSHDKLVLVSGILLVLALFAAVLGSLAVRRLGYGLAGLAVFAAIGLIAAATRPTATPADALPTLAAAAAGAVTMTALIRAARAAAPRTSPDQPPAARTAAPGTSPGALARASSPALPAVSADVTPLGGARDREPGRVMSEPPQPERRRFLVAGGVAAGAAAAGVLGGRVLSYRSSVAGARASLRIPAPAFPAPPVPAGADLRIGGLSPFITPNGAFYRVDTAIVVPQVAPASWMLRIHGMVRREIRISFGQLIRRPLTEDWITLCCVSNPVGGPYIGNARWLGASLAGLLRQAGVLAGASQLLCTSVDGFTSGVPVQAVLDGRDALLAVAMNGTPLPVAHGFPVRMVVPGLYGYVSACKWITDIEVTTYQAATAYWVPRGWDAQAPVKTESRIDVPNGSSHLSEGPVRVAGVAWAQHKGVDAVEVRADHGAWQQARLAAVPGIDTWRQWVWDWHATPGQHLIESRATDRTGYTQTAAQAPPEPNGATGYPSISVTVT
jgi:DMSO/TMAO reductase YedYZ molybdopterin-dependent catalytic subunit